MNYSLFYHTHSIYMFERFLDKDRWNARYSWLWCHIEDGLTVKVSYSKWLSSKESGIWTLKRTRFLLSTKKGIAIYFYSRMAYLSSVIDVLKIDVPIKQVLIVDSNLGLTLKREIECQWILLWYGTNINVGYHNT